MLPFDQREGYIWHDGALVEWKEAKLHVLTHGLHYASSVFEGVRIYARRPFMLREHIARLRASANILDFNLPNSDEELHAATLEVVAKVNIVDGYIRMNAWRGSDVIQTAALKTKIHASIAAWEIPSGYYAAADAIEKGITMQIGDYRRPSPASAPVKSKAAGNYMIGTISKNQALRNGFDDALLLDCDGNIAEATGAHIFFTKGGALYTPTTRCTIEGITRACVIELARKAGIGCVVGDLRPEFMREADGAFICGTACELLPATRIDGCSYHVKSNAVVFKLIAAYRDLTCAHA